MDTEQKAIYKKHSVTCSAAHETTGFLSLAVVSWSPRCGGINTIYLRFKKTYPNEQAARSAALEEAKAWIDKQPPI